MERTGPNGGATMAGMGDVGEMSETLRGMSEQARQAIEKFAQDVELERRMRENPLGVLGIAAAAGFVLGGGLWPVLRPFVKAAARTALSPTNLLAIGAAIGAMRAAGGGDGEMPEEVPGSSEPH